MAEIINTQECRCCHRTLPLDQLDFIDADELLGVPFNCWLCRDIGSCIDVTSDRIMSHNSVVILNGLLDNIDEWLFLDGPNPAWDSTLATLCDLNAKGWADQAEVNDLIARMEAKGLPLAAAMLKPEANEEDED